MKDLRDREDRVEADEIRQRQRVNFGLSAASTPVMSELHVTRLVTSRVVMSLYVPVAASCTVALTVPATGS